ncbi:MAG: TrbC/VirB2 family protein [Rhodanobacteraceae bacterium]
MKTSKPLQTHAVESSRALLRQSLGFTLFTLAAMPCIVLAQVGDIGDAGSQICGFLSSVNTLLNVLSVVVVTIAIIFSGYQIAFAHKRIGEIAPIGIGAILIGAASQIAKMILGGTAGAGCVAMVTDALNFYA